MNRERIGKYHILGEIGRGTMGEVLKARDPVLKRHVALKTLSSPLGPTGEALQRFQREAQAAALLNHPNIVTVHDFGEENGLLYMAMELLEGTDLRDAIDNDLLKTMDAKLDVMDQVLGALDYAHERGVVHRDIKPANIHLGGLRGPGRQVKIMDFGLARINTSEMTQEGIVLGTPNYMSPEQALGDKVDARSDLFSAGAVLYELLSGHKPFEADSTPSVLYQVVHRQPPPLARWAPGVPAPLVAVVNRALDKNRDRRYQTAAEMRAALAAARRAAEAPAPRVQPPPLPASARPARPERATTPPPVVAVTGGSRPGPAPDNRRASSSGARAVRRVPLRPLAWGAVLAGLAVVVFVAVLLLREQPAPAPPTLENVRVGALTHALVGTRVQLGQRELDDKNYAAAVAQAESALKLAPGHSEAARVLATARERVRELETTVAEARRLLEAGDTAGASRQLSHLLELDPRQPAAAELTARLNTVFRSQAEAAAGSMRSARDAALAKGAARQGPFTAAEAQGRDAQALAAKGGFADATRMFLEARDAFDRLGRAAAASHPAAAAAPTPTAPPATVASAPARAAPLPPTLPPAAADTPSPEPTAAVLVRDFAPGQTSVATAATGSVQGFESTDVRTRRPPQFAGRLEFEVLPAAVRLGEPFVVRIHLVNQGRRPVKIRTIALAAAVDGKRTPAPARLLLREVAPQQGGLVAEYSAVWSAGGTWGLEAVVTVDRDETITNRLSWN